MAIENAANRAAPSGRRRIKYVGHQEAVAVTDLNGGHFEFRRDEAVEVPSELADGRSDRAGLLARPDFEEVS